MIHLRLFEPEETPKIRVGMRMVKTVVAVYICAVIGYLRDESALMSMIAAVVCMQNTTEKSLRRAFNRTLGTVMGALYGVLMRYIGVWTGIENMPPVYCLVLSVMLIPILLSTLVIKKPSISSFACTLFLSVAMSTGIDPIDASIRRVIETVIGIVVALVINTILPKRRAGIKEQGAPSEDSPVLAESDKENEDTVIDSKAG